MNCKRLNLFFSATIVGLLLATCVVQAEEPTLNQSLIVACYKTDVVSVVRILREGADVNCRFGKGDCSLLHDPVTNAMPLGISRWTPLIALAVPITLSNFASYGQDEKFDESVLTIDETSLVGAIRIRNRIEICRMLVSHGCDIDVSERNGETALHYAAQGRSLQLAKVLVTFGANPNIATAASGRTALHAAAWSDDLRQFMIAHGAKDDVKDEGGITPKARRDEYNAVFNEKAVLDAWDAKNGPRL